MTAKSDEKATVKKDEEKKAYNRSEDQERNSTLLGWHQITRD